MMYNFDIDAIASRLEKYKGNLETLYEWKLNVEKLKDFLSEEKIEELKKYSSSFEKQVQLKKLICEKMKETRHLKPAVFENLCLWIIKDWGGITGGKSDKVTKEMIRKFLPDCSGMERIASMSKVAAFLQPDTHVIYDARVAYALNWFILSENAGERFFPIPEGRNSKMNAFDLNVLIRLKHIEKYRIEQEGSLKGKFISTIDNKLYIPAKEAYSELNKTISLISNKLWGGPKMLFYTEMLLFALADREVFREITDSVGISIKFKTVESELIN
jgi:hypothetical protein